MISLDRVLDILILLIALVGTAPLVAHLDAISLTLLGLAAVAAIIGRIRGSALPPLFLTLASIALVGYYASRFNLENVARPTASLLTSFLAVRIAGERTGRTILQICALSLFCLAASTLFSLGPFFLASLVLLSLLVVAALVIVTFFDNSPAASLDIKTCRFIAKLIISLTVAALPLMILFFVILPRTQYPLWDAFAPKSFATTGMSDRVEPGRTGSIEESRSVAFRVATPYRDKESLYWRGAVFNSYNSRAWTRVQPPAGESGLSGRGERILQTFMPEPGKLIFLVALDHPAETRGIRASTSGDLVSRPAASAVTRNRYEAISVPGELLRVNRPINREFYLKLPADMPPRLASAARDITRNGADDRLKLERAEAFFRKLDLSYATTNLPSGENHLDRFLFEVRHGHCEFFASSFALLMRAAGVPSRVVGGYYGGIYNKLGGYYVVTDEMAHAWTEIFIADEGWLRVDPSRWASGFDEVSRKRVSGTGRELATLIDTMIYFWDVTVITYDLGKQLQIAQTASGMFEGRKNYGAVRHYAVWLLAIAAAATIAAYGVRRHATPPEERLLKRFLQFATSSTTPPVGTGILEIAAQTKIPEAVRFAEIYSRSVYHDRRLSAAERQELSQLLRCMKKTGYSAASRPVS